MTDPPNTKSGSPLLFIASDRRELQPWVSRWDNLRSLQLPVHWAKAGTWRGKEAIAIANGVGTRRAAGAIDAAITLSRTFAGIFSVGTGGALDTSLSLADVVVAKCVTDGQTTWPALDPAGQPARFGLVRTVPHIARTAAEKTNLREAGAILVEMEAAAVATAASQLVVPFYCVRVVSDLANETFFIDFEQFLMPNGGFNVPRLVMHALRHPVEGLPELLRLQQRTSAAAKKLGEFLSHCNF